MYSFWERESFLQNHDLIIIGGGIVGLSVAASVLDKYPKKRVVILEKGILPTGASTKNAGFVCTDSFTEFLEDIQKMGEQKAIGLFYSRYLGMTRLLKRIGIEGADAIFQGSYELIIDEKKFSESKLKYANDLLRELFKKDVFQKRNELIDTFGFNKNIAKIIVENVLEGQIDSGKAIRSLYQYVTAKGALYLTGSEVISYMQIEKNKVQVKVINPIAKDHPAVFEGQDLVICTNGFTNNLSSSPLDLVPGRGQVLITKPIKNLKIKGIYHYDEGFYYFRDFYGRLLLGGGRNLDFKGEQTTEFENTPKIMDNLVKLMKEVLLPNTPFEIDTQWSGIMCFSPDGKDKTPILMKESENIIFAVRMNGMGVALASNVAVETCEMLYGQQKPSL